MMLGVHTVYWSRDQRPAGIADPPRLHDFSGSQRTVEQPAI